MARSHVQGVPVLLRAHAKGHGPLGWVDAHPGRVATEEEQGVGGEEGDVPQEDLYYYYDSSDSNNSNNNNTK